MKRAAIYARVSCDKQLENQSLDVQLADCRKLAEREGHEVIREYVDGGYSGMTSNRPDMQALLADADARLFDAVIVWDQSRFGRDFVDVELNLRRLEQLGITFRAVYGPTGDDDTAKLTRRILAAVYEKEQQDRNRRLKAGRRMKALAGRGWPGGVAPYGYKHYTYKDAEGKTNTSLIEHPDEAPVVRLMFDLYTSQGYSAFAVTKYLNAQGLRNRSGGIWWSSQIRRMLASEVYAGRAFFFKTTADGKPVDRSDWVAIDVPVLVDDETLDRARRLLATDGGRRGPSNGVWPEADLKGLLFCECGLAMIARHHREVHTARHYYKCRSGHSHEYDRSSCPRESPYVYMEPVDEAVWQALLAEMDDADRLERKFVEYHRQLDEQQNTDAETAQQIRSELDKITRQEAEAWDIYDGQEAGWDREQLKRRLADLKQKREALERRLEEIETVEQTAIRLKQAGLEVRRLAAEYRDRLHNLPRKQRRAILSLLIKRVTLHADNSLTIEWHFPAVEPAGPISTSSKGQTNTCIPPPPPARSKSQLVNNYLMCDGHVVAMPPEKERAFVRPTSSANNLWYARDLR